MEDQDSKLQPSPNWVKWRSKDDITHTGDAFPAPKALFAVIQPG